MLIIYRCSDKGNPKDKPAWINLFACLENFVEQLTPDDLFEIWCDNCESDTVDRVCEILERRCECEWNLRRTSMGNSGSFRAVLRELDARDSEDIYLVEDDQWHLPGALDILRETLAHESARSTTFYTPYDHPDNYDPRINHMYPNIPVNRQDQFVRHIAGTHWRLTPSTTMTFAGKRWAFQHAAQIMEQHCETKIPNDFAMWCELTQNVGYRLQCAIPGLATHGETAYLAPSIQWEELIHHPGTLRNYVRNAIQSPEITMNSHESGLIDEVTALLTPQPGQLHRTKIHLIIKEWDHRTRLYASYFLLRAAQRNPHGMSVTIQFERFIPKNRTWDNFASFIRLCAAENADVRFISGPSVKLEDTDIGVVVYLGSAYGSRVSQLVAQSMGSCRGFLLFGTSKYGDANWNENAEEVMKDMRDLNLLEEDRNKTMNEVLGVVGNRGMMVKRAEGEQGSAYIQC